MARIRTIKPEFWTSEQIVSCSPIARLMFIGLWNFCDDGGRMPFSVKNIKMRIFPGDDISSENVRGLIGELSGSALGKPLVVIYEFDGKEYLQITGWDKHQRIERPNYQFPDKNGVIPQSVGFRNPRAVGDRSTPEGKGRESKGKEWNGMEGKGEEGARARASPPSQPPTDDWPNDYREQFAAVYPQKVRMTAALDILEKTRRDGKVSWRVMMDALASYARKTDDAYWASPTNWLKEERWNDRPAPPPSANGHVTDADIAAELAREAGERRRSAQAAGDEAQRGGCLPAGGGDAELPGPPGRRTG